MINHKFSEVYRRKVPETLRIKARNIQYFFDDIIFLLRYIFFKIKNRFKKDIKVHNKSICYIIPTTQITGGVAVVCEHLNQLQKN